MRITDITVTWGNKYADPQLVCGVDMEPRQLPWQWMMVEEGFPSMLISRNMWPWIRFKYINDPSGRAEMHGALGDTHLMEDGTELKTTSGWSSRAGVINKDYAEYLSGREIISVLLRTPGSNTLLAGLALDVAYLKRHLRLPKHIYLVREERFNPPEPYWFPSLDPDKVVKPSTET